MNDEQKIQCPLCKDTVDHLLYRFHFENERAVIDRIKKEYPAWAEGDGICSRCIDYYQVQIIHKQNLLPEIGPYFPVRTADDFVVLPTALRLNAHPKYTGKEVTICFIDSGFCLHPDLTVHKNRIKSFVDITKNKTLCKVPSTFGRHRLAEGDATPKREDLGEAGSWHGTMTATVCAGDGFLSKGLYKGIASDAELVLLKVQNEEGKITDENIVKALEWVLENYQQFNIRIVNLSLSGDCITSYKENKIDKLAEQLIEKGIVVVAAVGNANSDQIFPPANSPNAITVGSADDQNSLCKNIEAYHSNSGQTIDGFIKPELIAPAIWIAAPILPATQEQKEAEVLHSFLQLKNEVLNFELQRQIHYTQLDASILNINNPAAIKDIILKRIQAAKYISAHYMHVDGTSFAAPIVSSVVAQMLEANPTLSPQAIRRILFSTAKRIDHIRGEQQGFGMIQPRKAILKLIQHFTPLGNGGTKTSPFVNKEKNTIELFIENGCAEEISVAGSFNHWAQDVLLMEPFKNGFWKLEMPMLPSGKYHYKFFIDRKRWVEDVENPYREPDGFNGFNSLLIIKN